MLSSIALCVLFIVYVPFVSNLSQGVNDWISESTTCSAWHHRAQTDYFTRLSEFDHYGSRWTSFEEVFLLFSADVLVCFRRCTVLDSVVAPGCPQTSFHISCFLIVKTGVAVKHKELLQMYFIMYRNIMPFEECPLC